MTLEKAIDDFARLYADFEPVPDAQANDPQAWRQRYRRLVACFEPPRPTGIEADDRSIAGPGGAIPVRVYRRRQASLPAPCCLFFHGGGWMLGDLDTHDTWAAELALASGATVIAVDYRMGPEHRYPAAFDDAWQVLVTVAGEHREFGIDPARIAVYGDSAGGNLAAAICLKARDEGAPAVAGQVLVYPALHRGEPLPSYLANRDAPVLPLSALETCWRTYLGNGIADAYAAPLGADDFAGLPPAWIIAAGHDPLRDDGLRFADRLRNAGVPVTLRDDEALVHGCFRVRHHSPATRLAWQFSADAVATALGVAKADAGPDAGSSQRS